jgi:hypothetical protein
MWSLVNRHVICYSMLSIGTYATFTKLRSMLANMAFLYQVERSDQCLLQQRWRYDRAKTSYKTEQRCRIGKNADAIDCLHSIIRHSGVEEASSKDSGKQKSIIVSHWRRQGITSRHRVSHAADTFYRFLQRPTKETSQQAVMSQTLSPYGR